MTTKPSPLGNQKGSAINIALLILVLITVVVLSLNRTTTTDIKIAANEKTAKVGFYAADGGTAVGAETLEQNIACPSGFTPDDPSETFRDIQTIRVTNLGFWTIETLVAPSDSSRHIYFPSNYNADPTNPLPHTNVTVSGRTEITEGGSIQMAAGYEGKGKAAAGGGVILRYDIWSQHVGAGSSKAEIRMGYRHVVGLEGECLY